VTFDLILVGFGNVGRRFVRLLDELRPDLEREHRVGARIVGITTRSHGQIYDAAGLNGADLAAAVEGGAPLGPKGATLPFLERTIARERRAARARQLVVVETTTLDIAGGQPAIRHVRTALAGGAHVITCNKGPAAFAFHELEAAARRAGRCFLFESAVMDGVPLFNLKRAALPGVRITGFQGVVNSTTNYILTAMEQGESFDSALEAMQRAGIAEADASLDVDGWDAAAKTAILANAMMGAQLTPQRVEREPLSASAAPRIHAARPLGRRLKIVASAENTSGALRARVRLVELPETDLLAQLDGQQNAIVLQTDALGEVAIVQRGSGLTQTAYGLVADLVSVARQINPSVASRPARPRARPGRTRATRARRRS
jgi:homoserine dehydrogenase